MKMKWLISIMCGVALMIAFVLYRVPREALGFDSQKPTNITASSSGLTGAQDPAALNNNTVAEINNTAVEIDDANAINVKSYNAKGDGVTNDTAAIQAAVDAVPPDGGTVVIPEGVYLVDAVQSIRIKNGVTLKMAPNTVLKAVPNNSERYAVLTIKDASNITIQGGVIEGERAQHTGTTGEWGMGIQILGSSNITVANTVCNNLWGDGFYIGSGTAGKVSEDVRLIDVQADNNRRQGISLICGRRIEIIRPRLTNTNGTLPSAGIDIEPNKISDVLEEIKLVEPFTAGNAGAGISVVLQQIGGTNAAVSIEISNHHDDASDRGMLIASNNAIVPGNLLIENPEWDNSKRNGLSIQRHDHRSFHIAINQPRVIDANRSGKRDGSTGAAIAIYHNNDNKVTRTGGIGNVHIYSPVIGTTQGAPKMMGAFYIQEMPNQEIQELTITDPVIENSSLEVPDSAKQYIKYNQGQ
ncbi:MAG TPA: glycosyl hydrolase family 28-related protein [Methylomusa anaerophila]|nr:glycosyl hydrolase family 28-related protein [Methylomusa anaerophila]HML88165.1 glycosyl hydrolase family 28-related protein [Methylomusa anaerophila]